jgi:TetR/AcrR family transcriptional regulator
MRKSAELRKAQIVATILDLADRIGPDRVTTGAVAAEIGVTQAAVFRHFPTKAEMWVAVADHVAGLLTTAWAEALEGATLPTERLTALVGAQLDQITANPALPMLLFSRELNVENAALRDALRDRLVTLHGLLLREVVQGQEDRTLSKEVAAADVAVLLTSLIQGVAIRWSLGARDFPLREEGLRLLAVQLRLLGMKEG